MTKFWLEQQKTVSNGNALSCSKILYSDLFYDKVQVVKLESESLKKTTKENINPVQFMITLRKTTTYWFFGHAKQFCWN